MNLVINENANLEIEKKDKLMYIEVLRIISCFAVILLHCVSSVVTNYEIYGTTTWNLANLINAMTRFAVPIFFMISGFLALHSKKEIKIIDFIKKKFVRLVIPLFAFSFFYYFLAFRGTDSFSILDFLFKFISKDVEYHLWFMFSLFALELLVPLLKKLDKQTLIYIFTLSILSTTICPCINKIFDVWLFRFEPLMYGYVGFFILGYLLGTAEFSKKQRLGIYLSGVVWILISYFGNIYFSSFGKLDLYFNGGYTINLYFIATAIFVFAKYNFNEIKNIFINKSIIKLGSLSFYAYLFHVFALNTCKNIPNSGHILELVLLAIPTFLFSMLLAYVLNEVLKIFKKNCKEKSIAN